MTPDTQETAATTPPHDTSNDYTGDSAEQLARLLRSYSEYADDLADRLQNEGQLSTRDKNALACMVALIESKLDDA